MNAGINIIKRLREGQQDALLSLMNTHYHLLFREGVRYTADKDLSKEIICLFFLYVWEHRGQVAMSSDLQRYLLISFRNFLFNYLRQIALQLELPYCYDEPTEYEFAEQLLAWQQQPALRDALSSAMQSLNGQQQELIRLRYYESTECEKIAKRLSVSVRSVNETLAATIKKLASGSLVRRLRNSQGCMLLPFVAALLL